MDSLSEVESAKNGGARRGFTRGRILVVDDDVALLGLIEDGLAHAGFEVIAASDGIDALSSMYARRPDVVLVDLAMPRMDGVELIAQVCSEAAFRQVTVIAMSGHEVLLQRATEAGAGAAMVKPLSMPTLIAALVRHERRDTRTPR